MEVAHPCTVQHPQSIRHSGMRQTATALSSDGWVFSVNCESSLSMTDCTLHRLQCSPIEGHRGSWREMLDLVAGSASSRNNLHNKSWWKVRTCSFRTLLVNEFIPNLECPTPCALQSLSLRTLWLAWRGCKQPSATSLTHAVTSCFF